MLGKLKIPGQKTRGNLSVFHIILKLSNVFHLGYVCSIKEELFVLTKEKQKKIKDTYKDKVSEPLTSQFLEKTPKNEAIKHYRERKAKTAELFSPGK